MLTKDWIPVRSGNGLELFQHRDMPRLKMKRYLGRTSWHVDGVEDSMKRAREYRTLSGALAALVNSQDRATLDLVRNEVR